MWQLKTAQGKAKVLAIKEAKEETGKHGYEQQQNKVSVPGRGEKSAPANLLQSDTDSLSEEGKESWDDKKDPNGEKSSSDVLCRASNTQ